MPKNIVQDVIIKNDRSIRRIPIPDRTRKNHVHMERPHSYEEQQENIETYEESSSAGGKKPGGKRSEGKGGRSIFAVMTRGRLMLAGSILAAVIIISFIAAHLSGAIVTVHPKQYDITLATTISASVRTPSDKDLSFMVLSSEEKASDTIAATGEKQVEKKASGTIVIYNNYSSAAQRLIVNTRFETANNLVYRLVKSVVVPGKVVRSGKTIPGSIEVVVVADNVGEKYNIGLSDFTIPGFKGTPKYTGFYARSKTAMSGGFVGKVKVVDESLREKKRKDLRLLLEAKVRSELASAVPAGMIMFPSLTAVTFVTLPESGNGNNLEIHEQAKAGGVVLVKNDFLKTLAAQSITNFDGSEVSFEPLDILKVAFAGNSKISDNTITLKVNGSGKFTAVIDEKAVTSILADKPKKFFNEAISSLPGIAKAEAIIRPFWRKAFPKNSGDIKVDVALD